jgi:hypothetical protein
VAHFELAHDFGARADAVAALLLDPDFMTSVQLPDLALPSVVAHGTDRLQLRYEYTGQLDPIARRVVGGRKLTWVQDFHFDRANHRGALTITAESMADKVHAHATVAIVSTASGCRRTITGEFSIRIPLVGGRAEKAILPGVLRRLDVEAVAVRARLAGQT